MELGIGYDGDFCVFFNIHCNNIPVITGTYVFDCDECKYAGKYKECIICQYRSCPDFKGRFPFR